MEALIAEYNKKKHQIKKRLKEFKSLCKAAEKDIFSELCFCILTPQTKAVSCDKAIQDLRKSRLLFKGCKAEIGKRLKGRVRFHNNKAAYVIAAREFFFAQGEKNGRCLELKSRLSKGHISETRDWLVRNIKGLGYKEASHFLRNVGRGENIAIIDRHILDNLKNHGVIKRIPASISKKAYIDIESRMRKFSTRLSIPMEELDLLFWSDRTGFIFK